MLFSLPLIAGNLIQQLYNVVDTLIVGRIIGANALAAVGSAYALMVLLTSVILGLCMGSSVVFSQLYGSGETVDMKISIANAACFVLAASVLLSGLSLLFLDPLLALLRIPVEALAMARTYLKIILLGMIFTSLYNIIAAILRSVGNTAVPLVFLAIAALLNTLLDLLFVCTFSMGVAGAALATIIAQFFSAAGLLLYFWVKEHEFAPKREHFRFRRDLMHRILQNSVLVALQQSIMNFGILLVQGLVNSFGFAASAAFAAVVKIDAFAYMPAQDFGNAFSTYVAQNYGAGQHERIRKGLRTAMLYSVLFCLVASAAVSLFAKPLMLLFVDAGEREIIAIGMRYLRIEGSFYAGIGILFLWYAFFRGKGEAKISLVLTIASLGVRVVLAYALSAVPGIGLVGIWWAIPIGWILADLLGFYYDQKSKQTEKKSIV